MAQQITRVVCALIQAGDKILVARRALHKANGGMWEFPGGKIDGDETASAALSRELKEELGIEVTIDRTLTPVIHQYEHFSIELIPFVCSLKNGNPIPHEHDAIAWILPAELSSIEFSSADISIAAEFLNMVT